MAIEEQGARLFGGQQAEAFDAACHAALISGFKVKGANPAYGSATLSTGMSMMSWGETMQLTVQQVAPGVVAVTLSSGLKFGLVDWGRNRKNLEKFFGALAASLPEPPAAPAWFPDPSGRHEYRWWDGTAWTPTVSDAGQQSQDPLQ